LPGDDQDTQEAKNRKIHFGGELAGFSLVNQQKGRVFLDRQSDCFGFPVIQVESERFDKREVGNFDEIQPGNVPDFARPWHGWFPKGEFGKDGRRRQYLSRNGWLQLQFVDNRQVHHR
jgi:hypothetical protein